jgi:hypothetical protein
MNGFGRISFADDCILYEKANANSKIVKDFCYCGVVDIDEISGDWVKIIFDEEYAEYRMCECPENKSQSAWLKWREGDKIKVDVYIAE